MTTKGSRNLASPSYVNEKIKEKIHLKYNSIVEAELLLFERRLIVVEFRNGLVEALIYVLEFGYILMLLFG